MPPINTPPWARSRPVRFTHLTTTVVWWAVNLATPILYPRGNLARIKTIHFAHWVLLDGKRKAVRQRLRRQRRKLHGRLRQQGFVRNLI